jgi:hypothetical protein
MIYTNQKNLMTGLKIEAVKEVEVKAEVHQNPLSILLR